VHAAPAATDPEAAAATRAALLAEHTGRLQASLDALGRELGPAERHAVENALWSGSAKP
jgi:hypothetical protein